MILPYLSAVVSVFALLTHAVAEANQDGRAGVVRTPSVGHHIRNEDGAPRTLERVIRAAEPTSGTLAKRNRNYIVICDEPNYLGSCKYLHWPLEKLYDHNWRCSMDILYFHTYIFSNGPLSNPWTGNDSGFFPRLE